MNIFNVNVCHNFPIFHHIQARGEMRGKGFPFEICRFSIFNDNFIYVSIYPEIFDKSQHKIFSCFLFFFLLLLLVFSLLLLQLYLRHSANSERKRETTTSWANLLTELPLIVQWAEAGGAWLLVFNFPLRLLKHRRVHVCVCVCVSVRNFMIALYCSFCCCWSFKFIFCCFVI